MNDTVTPSSSAQTLTPSTRQNTTPVAIACQSANSARAVPHGSRCRAISTRLTVISPAVSNIANRGARQGHSRAGNLPRWSVAIPSRKRVPNTSEAPRKVLVASPWVRTTARKRRITTPVISASSMGDRAILVNAAGSSRSHSLDLNRWRRFSTARGFVTASNVTPERTSSIDFPAESREKNLFSPNRRRAPGIGNYLIQCPILLHLMSVSIGKGRSLSSALYV